MNRLEHALVRADGVTKVYNPRRPDEVVAVDDVSMSVARGEVVALKGPSGSGKTSLLSLIGCMARPTAGRILVNGENIAKLSENALTRVRRRKFGFIFQQFNLIPDVSVLENVVLPLFPERTGFAEMRRRAAEVLARLELGGKERRNIRKLSGGEQQRVAIARALINDPEIIVADEPTAHLDRSLSEDFLRILGSLNRLGKTVVIATHDPLVYEHPLVGRSISMRDGRVVPEDVS